MPRASWGVKSAVIDDFDRESLYSPYTGPLPPVGVYAFRVKNIKAVPATRDKLPQLRVGLELVPRDDDEQRFAGYFIMAFLPVSAKTAFRWVPFLDAIGVSSNEFTAKTITDEEGNVKKIGKWKNDGNTIVFAQVSERTSVQPNGDSRTSRECTWFGEFEGEIIDGSEEEDSDEYDDPDSDDDN